MAPKKRKSAGGMDGERLAKAVGKFHRQEGIAEIVQTLEDKPSLIPAVLQALKSGILLPMGNNADALNHSCTKWAALPKYIQHEMIKALEPSWNEDELAEFVKKHPDDLIGMLVYCMGVVPSQPLPRRTKSKSALLAMAKQRYTSLGSKLSGIKIGEVAKDGVNWRKFGAYTLLPAAPANPDEEHFYLSVRYNHTDVAMVELPTSTRFDSKEWKVADPFDYKNATISNDTGMTQKLISFFPNLDLGSIKGDWPLPPAAPVTAALAFDGQSLDAPHTPSTSASSGASVLGSPAFVPLPEAGARAAVVQHEG